MADPLQPLFDSLAGKRIPGGCPDCDAEQRIQQFAPNVWTLVIAHDDHCPVLRSRAAGSN